MVGGILNRKGEPNGIRQQEDTQAPQAQVSMPTYDYRCPSCDAFHAETCSVQDYQPKPACPTCKTPMLRTYSAPLITFKGQGFNAQSG